MTPILQLLLELAILIFAAKLGGLVSLRLRQPAVLGQLVVGLILGPTFLGLFQLSIFDSALSEETVYELAEIGVIFLMFLAGLEVDPKELLSSGRVSVLAGVLGVIVPLALGAVLALGFGFSLVQSAFIGLTLTATSVSISAQVLLELGLLRSREGLALLGAAVVDDVLVILLLSFFVATQGAGGAEQIIAVIGRMLLFGVIALGVGIVLPHITARIKRLPITEGVLAWAIVATLLYAWAAEEIGQLAAITGAFTVGIFFGRTAQRQEISHGMHALAYAFFVPLFLVSIGLKADIRQLQGSVIGFTLLFVLIAMVSKLVGSGLGARLAGMTARQSVRVGAGMISRGEVGLIVATVGLQRGLIGTELFTVVVVMVLATTLITPILLRWLFSSREVAHVSEPARIGD